MAKHRREAKPHRTRPNAKLPGVGMASSFRAVVGATCGWNAPILRVFFRAGSPKLPPWAGGMRYGPALQWTGMPTTVRSHAKINLGLYIGAPRPDGFHELATVYQTLELHDLVTVSAKPSP